MVERFDGLADVLRDALSRSADPVHVSHTMSRTAATDLLRLLDAEASSGTVVVPVKELYTTTESATLLGVSRSTLMKLIESGNIEAVKVGTHHRVPVDQLLAFKRARDVGRHRASESLNEFSARSDFRSNVTFRPGVKLERREPGEGPKSREQ